MFNMSDKKKFMKKNKISSMFCVKNPKKIFTREIHEKNSKNAYEVYQLWDTYHV